MTQLVADELLTVREVAERLKMHPATIWTMIKDGRITASKPGGKKTSPWRVRGTEIERLIRDGEVEEAV